MYDYQNASILVKMVLHYVLKKIIEEYGRIVVSDIRLYNILNDLHAFEYEPESTRFILKQVLLLRGKDILESQKRSLPATATINQYTKFITEKCGFAEKQVRYVLESIAYGIGWAKKFTDTCFTYEDFEQKLEIYAYLYHILGINITQIKGSDSANYEARKLAHYSYEHETYEGIDASKYNSYKHPFNKEWKDYITIPQDTNYLKKLNWKDKTGLGIVCGYNNIRAIDIDALACFEHCEYSFWSNPRESPDNKFDSFIEYCLYLLNLPKDYKWVVRTGSGQGIHIIFKCEDVEGLDLDITAFPSKKMEENLDFNLSGWFFEYKKNVEEDFGRLELFWKGHIAACPSRSEDYQSFYENSPFEPNHNQYEFINNKNKIPIDEPSMITISDVDNLLCNLCGTVASETHEYDKTKKRYSCFYHISKLENTQDSMGGFNRHKDDIVWLKNVNTIEGINSLGVCYVLEKQYDKAVECFEKANSDLSHFNLAELILFGYIKGTKSEALAHYNICSKSNRIYHDTLDEMKKFIDDFV